MLVSTLEASDVVTDLAVETAALFLVDDTEPQALLASARGSLHASFSASGRASVAESGESAKLQHTLGKTRSLSLEW